MRDDQALIVAKDLTAKIQAGKVTAFCLVVFENDQAYQTEIVAGAVSPLALLGGATMLASRLALAPEETFLCGRDSW